MNSRLALLALWVAFAAAAVGVGFGAAGLVGDPFTDGVTDAAAVGTPFADLTPGPTRASSRTPTGTSEPTLTGTAEPTPSGTSSRTPSGTSSRSPSSTDPTPSGGPGGSVTRGVTTRGGLVSATCRADSVRLSASPAVGWQIEEVEPGPDKEARVRFERSGGGEGRVEVRATCAQGAPRFSFEDDHSGSGEDSGGS